jgi:hypothetical protein
MAGIRSAATYRHSGDKHENLSTRNGSCDRRGSHTVRVRKILRPHKSPSRIYGADLLGNVSKRQNNHGQHFPRLAALAFLKLSSLGYESQTAVCRLSDSSALHSCASLLRISTGATPHMPPGRPARDFFVSLACQCKQNPKKPSPQHVPLVEKTRPPPQAFENPGPMKYIQL